MNDLTKLSNIDLIRELTTATFNEGQLYSASGVLDPQYTEYQTRETAARTELLSRLTMGQAAMDFVEKCKALLPGWEKHD